MDGEGREREGRSESRKLTGNRYVLGIQPKLHRCRAEI